MCGILLLNTVRARAQLSVTTGSCFHGHKIILKTNELVHVVEGMVRELDPEGCAERKAKRLKRRCFVSPGPNHSWHVDSMTN